jgi:hypothetical protein
MAFRCITVYTNNYEAFSDIYQEIEGLSLAENEEREIEGITVSDAGDVEEEYVDSMRAKPEVAVMKVKDKNITILQHGQVFEVLFPQEHEQATV